MEQLKKDYNVSLGMKCMELAVIIRSEVNKEVKKHSMTSLLRELYRTETHELQ